MFVCYPQIDASSANIFALVLGMRLYVDDNLTGCRRAATQVHCLLL